MTRAHQAPSLGLDLTELVAEDDAVGTGDFAPGFNAHDIAPFTDNDIDSAFGEYLTFERWEEA